MSDAAHATNALRVAAELSSDPVLVTTAFGGERPPVVVFANQAFRGATGFTPAEVEGRCPWTLLRSADGAGPAPEALRMATAGQPFSGRVACPRRDGSHWLAHVRLSPVHDPAGAVSHHVASFRQWAAADGAGLLVGVEPGAERAGAEVVAHEAEEQLRQSRKMEAVGRLAGGIAHDFNNLLTAIAAYADFLLDGMPAADPRVSDVQEIRSAVDRAVDLTRPLLSFTRRRRSQPQVIELSAVVVGMEKLLRRVIGEDVELVTVLRPPAGRVCADAGQMEQVVMNLAVNARDAMPDGGALVIETASVDVAADASARTREAVELARLVELGVMAPGPYVMLAVSDTGIGMDEATQSRLFEPFFTTKAAGEGTGLGLSTVREIVRESGGHVTFYSEPGGGSLFRIYIPRVDAEAHAPDLAPPSELTGGGEVVLVVEDDASVRRLARRALQRRGYTVLDAADGVAALELCARHDGRIDLMLADVVMPSLGGAELAAQLRHFRPGTRVLYMTGYAPDAPTRQVLARSSADVLEKPFTPAVLARRVRAALDARTTG